MKKISSLLVLITAGMVQAAVPPLQINSVAVDPISCLVGGSEEATIFVNAIGGQPPYEYKFGTGPFQPTPTFRTDVEGSLEITVRDSALNESIATVSTGPSALSSITYDINKFPCGSDNGTFTFAAIKNGAAQVVGAFTLTNNGVPVIPLILEISAQNITIRANNNLAPGNYIMTVPVTTVGSDCEDNTLRFTVKQVEPVVISSIETVATDTPVSGGTLRINVTGGSGDLLFAVEGPGVQEIQQNNPVFSNLPAGTFTVTVTDQSSACDDPVTEDAIIETFENNIAQFLLIKHC